MKGHPFSFKKIKFIWVFMEEFLTYIISASLVSVCAKLFEKIAGDLTNDLTKGF